MTSTRWKAIKVTALLLAFTVSQVYVQASLSGRRTASAQPSGVAEILSGRLVTRQNRPVMVNGNSVPSGTTIFSGAGIETGAEVGATIDLGHLGRLDVGPNSKLTLTFSEGNVNVALQTGSVALTTNQGIKGSVTIPQGAVTSTDPSKLSSSVVVSIGDDNDPNAAVPIIPAVSVGAGATAASFGAAAAALTAGGIASSNGRGRGRNPSPTVPRRRR